ncbi:hypothetical protein C5167_035505 [Papaver somniferum]|uniref:Uncharacterized protein n=1 Tax=Papaver somniferum TaxID=3469 RepID=A0A4Y7KJ10_PAPSO|nr:hypothetical protein C5167_035505 [Papaver somniferum]
MWLQLESNQDIIQKHLNRTDEFFAARLVIQAVLIDGSCMLQVIKPLILTAGKGKQIERATSEYVPFLLDLDSRNQIGRSSGLYPFLSKYPSRKAADQVIEEHVLIMQSESFQSFKTMRWSVLKFGDLFH